MIYMLIILLHFIVMFHDFSNHCHANDKENFVEPNEADDFVVKMTFFFRSTVCLEII